jgi:hypothetical protein
MSLIISGKNDLMKVHNLSQLEVKVIAVALRSKYS